MKARSHPLTAEESAFALEAWEFGQSTLRRVVTKYRAFARDIKSEFAYQICISIHKWDRRRSLYLWSIFRLKKSVSIVLRRPRHQAIAGQPWMPDRHAENRYDSLVHDISAGLPARTAEIVKLAAAGHTPTQIGRRIGIDKSNVHRHLRRAKPFVIDALTP